MYQFTGLVAVLFMIGLDFQVPHAQASTCSSVNNACAFQIIMISANGTADIMNGQNCECRGPQQCSNDWNDRTRVISRKLDTSRGDGIMKTMYCQPMRPSRFCRRGENSAVFQDHNILPMDLLSHNCRCRGRRPLVMSEASLTMDYSYNYNHKYTCSYNMPTCSWRDACSTGYDGVREFNCQCPQGLDCKSNGICNT